MTELGIYKTFDNRQYRCCFDRDNRAALAIGPLPFSDIAARMIAFNLKEAAEGLSRFMGKGLFTLPVQNWK